MAPLKLYPPLQPSLTWRTRGMVVDGLDGPTWQQLVNMSWMEKERQQLNCYIYIYTHYILNIFVSFFLSFFLHDPSRRSEEPSDCSWCSCHRAHWRQDWRGCQGPFRRLLPVLERGTGSQTITWCRLL